MYHPFYHLKKEPFHITPDPEFLFLSPSHKQALGSIIYGVKNRKGFVVITGEVGVGKTTILRTYLESAVKRKMKVIFIFNSSVSFQNLLKTIYRELGLDPKTDDVVGMLDDLYRILMEEHRQGRTVLLIVDEAQNMPVETLENLRMLSNLETSKEKLLQIVLVGQPEFEEILDRHELRQLKQRIAIHSTIVPFTEKESVDYVRHRLAKVSIDDSPVFSKRALERIVKEAKGIPRTLNILCDNTLITGFGYKIRPASSRVVQEVLADFRGKGRPFPLKWFFASGALLFIAGGLFLLYSYGGLILSGAKDWIYSPTPTLSGVEKPGSPQTTEAGATKEEGQEVKPSSETPAPSQDESGTPGREKLEPGEEKKGPESSRSPYPIIRTVQKGDNLFRLTRKVYGEADDKMVALVKKNNPWIKDIDNIPVGKEIIFPEIKEKE